MGFDDKNQHSLVYKPTMAAALEDSLDESSSYKSRDKVNEVYNMINQSVIFNK